MIKRRRDLLPGWMKFFVWIFMLMAPLAVVSAVIFLFWDIIGRPFEFWVISESAIYGMETSDLISPLGIFINILFIFKGCTAFTMWTEKNIAIKLGLIDAILGIAICLAVMLVYPILNSEDGSGNFEFRIEILFLIPYLIKCLKIRKAWEQFPEPLYAEAQTDKPLTKEVQREPASKHPPAPIPEPKETPAREKEVKNDGMDREDPRRFMP